MLVPQQERIATENEKKNSQSFSSSQIHQKALQLSDQKLAFLKMLPIHAAVGLI
jgi:hypothetical protein